MIIFSLSVFNKLTFHSVLNPGMAMMSEVPSSIQNAFQIPRGCLNVLTVLNPIYKQGVDSSSDSRNGY